MQDELESIYHPPLDPSLIAAIANDTDDIDAAKATLDVLQAEAIADGFEDGYTSPLLDPVLLSPEPAEPDPVEPEPAVLRQVGDNEALLFLVLSFPRQSLTTLQFTLHKCRDDVARAVDELLNHEFIQRDKDLFGGGGDDDASAVDGFFDARLHKHRKAPRVRSTHVAEVEGAHDTGAAETVTSRWDQIARDTAWLCRVTRLEPSIVQSSYHAHGASLAATLNALLTHYFDAAPPNTENNDDADDDEREAMALKTTHPSLSLPRARQLLRATKGDLTLAGEAAQVLSVWVPSTTTTAVAGLTSDLKRKMQIARGQASQSPQSRPTTSHAATVSAHGMNAQQCRDMAAEYAGKRDAAFRQAAAAHQASKSDGLQGGAAMYYADIGRGHDAKMRAWHMKAAELSSVAKSRSHNDLDLHGLSVHEALAVTKDALARWYVTTDMLESGAFVSPLRIVTGLGLHSAGGEARILPAVKKYLDREGWKYSLSGGCVSVTGTTSK